MKAPSHPNAFVMQLGEREYPDILAQSPNPPAMLYGIGDPLALRAGLAVVGARRATAYGTRAARLFAGWAARSGYTVVSGGARGCDQIAQQAAVDEGGCSVAVLGSGADVDYPASSAHLLATLRDGRGAVVSEMGWGAPPTRYAFPKRNRIIAGLSAAVLVVEAGLPSGTFNTADHALDAGREVFVVPGSIFAPECRGSNRLFRQGAIPITDVSELAASLRPLLGEPSIHPEAGKPDAETSDVILASLRADPMRPDDVARVLGIDIVEVMRRIGSLEARSLVRRYPDGRFGM